MFIVLLHTFNFTHFFIVLRIIKYKVFFPNVPGAIESKLLNSVQSDTSIAVYFILILE